jgi:hypothetical protein
MLMFLADGVALREKKENARGERAFSVVNLG